jgi:hypothetical protein
MALQVGRLTLPPTQAGSEIEGEREELPPAGEGVERRW